MDDRAIGWRRNKEHLVDFLWAVVTRPFSTPARNVRVNCRPGHIGSGDIPAKMRDGDVVPRRCQGLRISAGVSFHRSSIRTQAMRGIEFWVTPENESLAAVAGIAGPNSGYDWSSFHQFITLVPPGRWTTYGDVGDVIGVHPRALGSHLANCSSCPYGAHRILRAGGIPASGFRWSEPENKRTCQEVLTEEGLTFDPTGHADPDRHLNAAALSSLLADVEPI